MLAQVSQVTWHVILAQHVDLKSVSPGNAVNPAAEPKNTLLYLVLVYSTVTVAEEPSDADASSEDDVIAIPSFGSQHQTEEPAREELPTEEPAREGLPTEEPAQKEWLTGGTAPV